jgi:hypothetical protein
MSSQALAGVSDARGDESSSRTLCVVAHKDGWAVKYGDSFLGATARLADALDVMATLANHTSGDRAHPRR